MTPGARIHTAIHKPRNMYTGVIPGWPCQVKTCEADSSSLVEMKINSTTWYLWSCLEHAGNLEDLFGGLAE